MSQARCVRKRAHAAYEDRFAAAYGDWRLVVREVADKLLRVDHRVGLGINVDTAPSTCHRMIMRFPIGSIGNSPQK